jgi:glycosyltransferase involved in cell wall biosynthesis
MRARDTDVVSTAYPAVSVRTNPVVPVLRSIDQAVVQSQEVQAVDIDTVASLPESAQSLLIEPSLPLPESLVTADDDAQGPAASTFSPPPVRVSVVVPTLNEADNLPHVLTRLPAGIHELIVVDGHSTDDTVAVVRRLRPDAHVVLQDGSGKGNALAQAFSVCTGDIVVTLDADGSTDPAEIPRFVAALCSGADFVKGSRFAQGGGSSDITRVRRLGNRLLSTLVNNFYGTSYTDLCYGYNAFWTRCLPYLRVDCNGFEVETLINVRIAKAGLVIHEVPSYERDRIYGRSNLHAVRDGIRVLSTIGVERIAAIWPTSRLPRIARRLMA